MWATEACAQIQENKKPVCSADTQGDKFPTLRSVESDA